MANLEEIINKAKESKKINLLDLWEFNLSDNEFDKLLVELEKNDIELVSYEDKSDFDESFEEKFMTDDSIRMYLNDIRNIKKLSPEEEREIFQKLFDLNNSIEKAKKINSNKLEELIKIREEVRNRIINSNLKLVVSIAKAYIQKSCSMTFLDLIQEGNFGLMKAIEKFDVFKGYKFSTYATFWIKQAIMRAISDKSNTIRIPWNIVDERNKVLKAESEFFLERGFTPSPKQLAEFIHNPRITEGKVREIHQITLEPLSLDMPVGEDEESLLKDFIPDSDNADLVDVINREGRLGFLEDVKKALESYPKYPSQVCGLRDQLEISAKREFDILCCRFGIIDGEPKTLEEVGAIFKITRERIRQIEKRALKKLNHSRLMKTYRD